MKVLAILTLALTGILYVLYHKLFTVIYTNVLAGFVREIAVCFVLAVIIVGTIASAFGFGTDSKESKDSKSPSQESSQWQHQQPSSHPTPQTQDRPQYQEQTGTQDFIAPQELPVMGFYGDFYSTAVLDGSIFNSWISFQKSDSGDNILHIMGDSYTLGFLTEQNFDVNIPMPEGNTFGCIDSDTSNAISLQFTLHPENHTVEVIQEPSSSNIKSAYTGLYVDRTTEQSMRPELDTAWGRIESACEQEGRLVTKTEPTPNDAYDFYADMNAYILEGNGTTYHCSSTENGSSITLTLARNDAYAALQYYYVSIYAYDSSGELNKIIEGFLTEMIDGSFGLYSDSGYLRFDLGESCIEINEYGTFISPDIIFTGVYTS